MGMIYKNKMKTKIVQVSRKSIPARPDHPVEVVVNVKDLISDILPGLVKTQATHRPWICESRRYDYKQKF